MLQAICFLFEASLSPTCSLLVSVSIKNCDPQMHFLQGGKQKGAEYGKVLVGQKKAFFGPSPQKFKEKSKSSELVSHFFALVLVTGCLKNR